VIKRNTPIPCRKIKTYSTVEDGQTSIDVCVYEGERPITTTNNLLGEFRLDGVQNAKRGEPQIDVIFELDANGILHVTAQDQVTKSRAAVSIKNATGQRSSEEIEEMIAQAEKMAKEDTARLALIEAKNELEQTLYSAKDAINRTMLPDEALVAKVAAIETWADEAGPGTPLSQLKAKLGELQALLGRA